MPDTSRYRYFDLCIESDLPLQGLVPAEDLPPTWRTQLSSSLALPTKSDWIHTWSGPGEKPIMAVAFRDGRYLLQFFGLALFELDFQAGVIVICPLEGCPKETLVHLLLDQVLPRAVWLEGRLVIHASAVVLPDDCAVAFLGASGQGKSTLASAFFQAGCPILSDDCLLLETHNHRVMVSAPYSSMRLWSDSADALFTSAQKERLRASRMAHYSDKVVLSPKCAASVDQPSPMPLRALYLLEPPGPLRVSAASGTAAIMSLVESQFALDVADRGAVSKGFAGIQQIAGQVPVFRLTYPRDFSRLHQVVSSIMHEGGALDTHKAVREEGVEKTP